MNGDVTWSSGTLNRLFPRIPVAPTITEHSYTDKLTVKAGSSFTIEIPFHAYPLPTATWAYKAGKLPDARRFRSDCISCMTTLVGAKVKPSDKGGSCIFVKIASSH